MSTDNNEPKDKKSLGHRIVRKVFRWIKYRSLRQRIKTSKYFISEKKINTEQKIAIKMVKYVAAKFDSEVLMAPISSKYYIKNKDIFIIVEHNMISIINSVYHYDIYTSDQITAFLGKYINRIIERKRAILEEEIKSKVDKSLYNIWKTTFHKLSKIKKEE